MLGSLAKKFFGNANDRVLKTYAPKVEEINALEPEIEKLSDDELKAKTDDFRAQLKGIEDDKALAKKLDELLVPAFAVVREAAKRSLGQRHYDVQLIGGMTLHDGKIAEMRTGEGKTLVATLAVYLNALAGKGVHVVTVNDYLAQRDMEWMGQVYRFLGLTVGVIHNDMDDDERQKNYACDVTYGTNNEYGFDYLRDNMKFEMAEMVQRGHFFSIVDEVDSILVDEARTPLIISGPTDDLADLYTSIDKFIPMLVPEDYEIEEKHKTATLTEEGNIHVEELLGEAGMLKDGTDSLYDIENVSLVHHINQALRAHKIFKKDKDYIVKDDEVVIIDEFTGRMMDGRRYSDGQHQALEAKENVSIQPENVTLASVTFQNYFRLYEKLSGMTGTALTEAGEFMDIYGLAVLEIPTNREVLRIDEDDAVYRTAKEKYDAIIELIKNCQDRGQPILVGTTSIEKSEMFAEVLKKKGLKHQVLNARFHEQEAKIIAMAGVPGAVTIATNMAGRGTDIQLGGNLDMMLEQKLEGITDAEEIKTITRKLTDQVTEDKKKALEAGGLYVVGTERHESRRIDNQLRGRTGRQGDPGNSMFFLSLEDDLMRIFGSDRMDSMLVKLGLEEGEAIVHPWINKALEKAQQKVEAHNFDMRKNLLKYDDVMNDQRKVIFEQRIEMMESEDVSETIEDMRHHVVEELVDKHIPEKAFAEQWDIKGLDADIQEIFAMELPVADWAEEEGIADDEIYERLIKEVDLVYAKKAVDFTPDIMRQIEKSILLQTLDHLWREHLVTLEHLRQAVGLRGYGQRDPLNEYKTEAFTLFSSLLASMRKDVTGHLFHIELADDPNELMDMGELPEMEAHHDTVKDGGFGDFAIGDEAIDANYDPNAMPEPSRQPVKTRKASADIDPDDPSSWGKVPRNAPCPCGSGKKFKHCHGKLS